MTQGYYDPNGNYVVPQLQGPEHPQQQWSGPQVQVVPLPQGGMAPGPAQGWQQQAQPYPGPVDSAHPPGYAPPTYPPYAQTNGVQVQGTVVQDAAAVEYWEPSLEDMTKQAIEDGVSEKFSFKEGDNWARVVPPRRNEMIYALANVHWFGDKTTRKCANCAREMCRPPQPCRLCAWVEQLLASGQPADYDAAKDMRAQLAYYWNLVVRSEPHRGAICVKLPFKQVHKPLFEMYNRDLAQGASMANPYTGYDVCINRTGKGQNDTRYTVTPARNQSPLAATEEEIRNIIAGQEDLRPLVRVPSDNEVMMLMGAVQPRQLAGYGPPPPQMGYAPPPPQLGYGAPPGYGPPPGPPRQALPPGPRPVPGQLPLGYGAPHAGQAPMPPPGYGSPPQTQQGWPPSQAGQPPAPVGMPMPQAGAYGQGSRVPSRNIEDDVRRERQ